MPKESEKGNKPAPGDWGSLVVPVEADDEPETADVFDSLMAKSEPAVVKVDPKK